MPLTDKRKRFIEAYCGSAKMNAARAARIAGYADPKKRGYELKRLLAKEIDARMKEIEHQAGDDVATQATLLKRLSALAQGDATETVVSPSGKPVEVPVNAKTQLNAIKELLKRYPYDPMTIAKVEKVKADAEVAKEKAALMRKANDPDQYSQLEKLLDAIEGGVGRA